MTRYLPRKVLTGILRVNPWVVAAFVIGSFAAYRTAVSNNPGTWYEAGDSAGDALQVLKAFETGWFATGHHTDVGVPHPGPFSLWLKALAELVAPHTGATTLFVAAVLFTFVKAVSVVAAGAAIASLARRHSAGVVFIAVVFAGGWDQLSDPVGVGMHLLSGWVLMPAVAASAAALAGRRGFLPIAIIATGATLHAHTVTALPAGVLSLVLAVKLFAGRRLRVPSWWGALTAWVVFAVPLAVRVFAEPGWPLSYRTAVANRVTGAENVPRAPYELLAERMQVDVAHAFVYLTMTLVIPSIIFVMRRRWRVAMIPFIVFAAWAVAVALLSPQNQRQATELWWVTGWWSMACGAVAALAITMVVSRLPRFVDVAAAAAGAGFVLAAAGSLFTGAISGSVGVDGSYVPDAVRTIEERSDGRRVAVLVRSQWLMVEMGLVLALERAGSDYCVLIDRSRTQPEQLTPFITESMMCGDPGDEVIISSVLDPSRALPEVWYRQERDDDARAMHPYFVIGPVRCDPRVDEGGCPDEMITSPVSDTELSPGVMANSAGVGPDRRS